MDWLCYRRHLTEHLCGINGIPAIGIDLLYVQGQRLYLGPSDTCTLCSLQWPLHLLCKCQHRGCPLSADAESSNRQSPQQPGNWVILTSELHHNMAGSSRSSCINRYILCRSKYWVLRQNSTFDLVVIHFSPCLSSKATLKLKKFFQSEKLDSFIEGWPAFRNDNFAL